MLELEFLVGKFMYFLFLASYICYNNTYDINSSLL
jgi:hypothetical protein